MARRVRACLYRPGRILILVLVVMVTWQFVALVPSASAAGPGTEAVQGLGSFFLTVPYGGIKMAVAVLGALAGGMGFLWGPSLGGDYVVTPEHIRGEKDLHFFGKGPAG